MDENLADHYKQKLLDNGKEILGLIMLVILVIGVFQPLALSGIPILYAVITFLGGFNVVAGITGLLLAIIVNIFYLVWKIPGLRKHKPDQ